MIAPLVIPLAVPLADTFEVSSPLPDGPIPDPGHVFVFHADGRQVFTADDRPVQVPDSFANS